MSMYEYNEIFNTGYGEGDGGAMYMRASLVSGYGTLFKGNYLHHSMEVPGLHGRGGIYFDDHCNAVQSSTENVFYKCAGRPFLVNGGAGNNISGNLFMNSGQGIFQQAYTNKVDCTGGYGDSCSNLKFFDTGVRGCFNRSCAGANGDTPTYNLRGDKSDYIWLAEKALELPVIGINTYYSDERKNIFKYSDLLNSSMAKRWPKFRYLMSINSTVAGWASAANSSFTNNIGMNITTDVTGASRRRVKSGGVVCFRRGWSGNADLKCDADIDGGFLNAAHHDAPMRQLVDTTGTLNLPEADWDATFPQWRQMEFVNAAKKIDTGKAGLYCDQYRRKMPRKSVYRPWVKQFFNGQPSCMKDCGIDTYSAETASYVASMKSGFKLYTDPSFNEDCPPLAAVSCDAYYHEWSGCRADLTQIMRYTIMRYPANGGTPCLYGDGYEKVVPCAGNIWV